MKLTIDTAGATAFELNVMSRALVELASQCGSVTPAVNSAPDNNLGNENPVSTAIPPAPVSAPESESPSVVPAAPSGTPAGSASAPIEVGPLDKAGFPWDARIHTANKAVIGDGTYRKKPGVDPALYASVQAEWTAKAPAVPAAPAIDPNAAATGAIPAAPAPETAAPAAPTLTAQDVLARCTEIQMSDMNKGAALFQAIVASGVPGGPMALPAVTDPAVLSACLAAVNAVAAA